MDEPTSQANWRDVVEDMVFQFAYRDNDNERRWLSAGGLSALEYAFEALGWDDPHYIETDGCEHPGCARWSTCGTPTPDGYKRLCSEHGRAHFRPLPPPPTGEQE